MKNALDALDTPPPQRRHRGAGTQPRGRALPWLLGLLLLAGAGGLWWWKTHGGAGGANKGAPDSALSGAPGAGGGPGGMGGAPGGRRFGGGNAAQPVSVQPVRRQDVRVTVNAIGSIEALNTAVVRVQVSGVLQSLNFKEGQEVKAGQSLAQIDPRSFQATLAQSEGALARDRAQLENARHDLERYRGLLAKDAIAKQQLDTQAALVAQLEGTVKVDQAAVDNARLQLSYTRVSAPISGRVGLKQLDLGNVAQPGDANGLVVITQTRPIAMLFAVPAAHVSRIVARLRAHETVPVEAWDRSGKQRLAVGRVASVDNAIDPATDTLKIKAVFPNADDALFPNQAVSVVLQLATLGDVLAVPQAAVLRGAQGFYVYVVNADHSVTTKVVKPGAIDGDWMAVEGALQPGEKVVVDGTDRLREGAKVEVIAADPSQRAGANAPPGGARRGKRGAAASAASAGAAVSHPAAGQVPAPGARAASAGGGEPSSAGERPAWMDRLPPEVVDKLMKMSPDERREWIRKRREERAAQGESGR